MPKVIEYLSLLFLGIILVLAFTHLINGTFIEWLNSKFKAEFAEKKDA